MIRKLAPLFILSLVFLNACSSGGGSSSGGGGGGTTPQPIMVNFLSLPPQSMTVGANQGVSATVTNDSTNKGVTWSCTPANSCGTFNPTSTPSGQNTTYVAPSSVPTGNIVTLIASSVTDTTKSAQAMVTITTPPPPSITVSISQAPPATLSVSGTVTVAATANNDPANAGVTWSCTPAGSCGTFSGTSTASGTTTTTYTAPSSVPAGGKVTLTATSATDTTKNAQSSILITGVASVASLNGQYAFLITAPTGNRGTTTWVGSVKLDGTGNVLGGEEDLRAPQYPGNDPADPILPTVPGQSPTSNYTVDPSGHGRLIMLTGNTETLKISFVVTSPSHAEVIEADGNPGSGTMDLQQPGAGFSASQISGGYSFTLVGIDNGLTPSLLSIGGVFSADGASNITSGTIDVNTSGSVSSAAFSSMFGSKILSGPDSNGRGELSFVPLAGATPAEKTRTFFFYMVSPKVLRLCESDGIAFMGGSAYAQGSASTTLLGIYVYQHSGWNPPLATPPTGRSVAAGQFSVTSGNIFSGGFSDANTGPPTTGSVGVPVSNWSYSIPPALNGTLTFTDAAGASTFNMYMVDPTLNILDPNNSSGGGGALLLHTDTHINGTGILAPQQAATPFLGNYAVNLNNSIAAGTTPNELDLVGVLSGDGTSIFDGAANFALADYDQNNSFNPTPMLGAPLSGTFAMGASGRAVGSFTVAVPTGAVSSYPFIPGATAPVTFNVAFYQVSNNEAFIVETDTQANVSGYLVLQQLP